MEEMEDPTEHVQEHVLHEAQHQRDKLTFYVALTAAILAACAAVASLMSGHHSNEAMVDQLRASDLWSYYQAKGIKGAVLSSKREIVQALGGKVAPEDEKNIERYKSEQKELTSQAEEKEVSSEKHLTLHLVFARAVTMFQLAIAIAAVSALSRKRLFWYLSLGFGALGILFLALGFF